MDLMPVMPLFEIGYHRAEPDGRSDRSGHIPHYYIDGSEVPKDEYYARWHATENDVEPVEKTSRTVVPIGRAH